MYQLVKSMLAIGAGFSPDNAPGLVIDRLSVPVHPLAVTFHISLLEICRETVEVLIIRQDGRGFGLVKKATEEFDYGKIDSLGEFKGTHPSVMQTRIKNQNWNFKFDPSKIKLSVKDKFLHIIEKNTGWRPGEYQNYKLL